MALSRPSTGFQVKKPDMPRNAIISEMRPGGVIRSAISQLADEAGAYVIISSTGSTADGALRNRQHALREALDGVGNAAQLHTDFYDRSRLATWVRIHPGLVTWVRGKIGRALVGWRPYGPWSGASEGSDAEYLLDDKLRLHLGGPSGTSSQSVGDAIDELRGVLAQAGKIVRLVGLSGVGKTRFVQALFDARVGANSLPASLAIYTNLADDPEPQPTGVASDLIANRCRAVLVIDNCPPDLHRRLSELCSGPDSTVSVLTVEYDVRDDHPEGTRVVTLDTSSPELIEKLVRRRYPHISQVDARTIADASGGNARIAVALAETVDRSDSIAGLSNDDLFQRLFRQRQDPNNALLAAAQACSLVYSFQGESLSGDEAELPCIASLAGQATAELYRHVGELLRRNLMQQRGKWRAVLPHAIANRLASRALEDIPYELIERQLVLGSGRLVRSFSRRLSFLHDHSAAVAIVRKWLAPNGVLGDVTALNAVQQAMFENVAPVLPEAALTALERGVSLSLDGGIVAVRRHLSLIRSLAYDADLFDRSACLLSLLVTKPLDEATAKEASDIFGSLFPIYLSGTHASVEQRLAVVERHLRSGEVKVRVLGLIALDALLKTRHFSSSYQFDFGARSRDYGFAPVRRGDVEHWYGACLSLIERFAFSEAELPSELGALLVRHFDGLWELADLHDGLARIMRRFAASGFWREGWIACRRTLRFKSKKITPDQLLRLSSLEAELRPRSLQDRVRAVVIGDRRGGFLPDDTDVDGDMMDEIQRADAIARDLGAAVVVDRDAFAEILPEILRGGSRVWMFGRGAAAATPDISATWSEFVDALVGVAPAERRIQVLLGFLAGVCERDRGLLHDLLDSLFDEPSLLEFLPALNSAGGLDDRGVGRLMRLLETGGVPLETFRDLAYGRATDHLGGAVLSGLLLKIAGHPGGFGVALEILFMQLMADSSSGRGHQIDVLEAGRELLRRGELLKDDPRGDHELASVVRACLAGPDDGPIAAGLAARLRQAMSSFEISSMDSDEVLGALLEVQPFAVLDALFSGDEMSREAVTYGFARFSDHRANPVDAVSCDDLITWCDGDRERRYPLAASIVTVAHRSESGGRLVWSGHAMELFARAPDVKSVLAVFIERFRPMSWSGSRASLIEANGRLLDDLDSVLPSSLVSYVVDAKVRIAEEVARERLRETARDRQHDERFE